MDPAPDPLAILADHGLACHVCATTTLRRRSMTHLQGPPIVNTDSVPICEQCDEDWTAAVYQADPRVQ